MCISTNIYVIIKYNITNISIEYKYICIQCNYRQYAIMNTCISNSMLFNFLLCL